MKKNVFPFLFIAATVINTLGLLVNNYALSFAYNSESGGYGWILLSGIILGASAYFLIKQKHLKICVIFLLVSAVLYFAFNFSSVTDMINFAYPTGNSSVSDYLSEINEEYVMSKLLGDVLKVIFTMVNLSILVPSIVLSSAILLVKERKIFTALTIVASIVALFSSGIFYALAILFMGLSIRMDFEELLIEKFGIGKR